MRLFGFEIQRREAVEGTLAGGDSCASGQAPGQAGGQAARGADISGNITYASGRNSSLTVPAFYRAITLRADTMARLTMQYQRRTPAGNYIIDQGITRGRHINYLLQVEPNAFTNWTTLMRQAEVQRMLNGNAYIYIERGLDGELVALWLCTQGVYNLATNSYTITYYVGNMPQTLHEVPAREVIHLRNSITTPDGFYGVPLLTYAARALNLSATQDQLTLETYAKGGRHKILLQEQAQQNMGLGKVQRKEMEKLRERVQEDLPSNDVLYVPNIASVENISQTFGELELSTMRKLSVADISRFTAVPRTLLGDDSNSSYKTPEAAMLDFYNNGIAPQIAEYEDEFNRKLLGEDGYRTHRFHLCEDQLFRLDRTAQAAWNKSRMETGIMSINELRAEQELPPIEHGDEHYVSTNLRAAGEETINN